METGHVKQVAAFEKLRGFCSAHGAMYNPSKASIKLTAVNALLNNSPRSLEAVKTLRTAYDNAVNSRKEVFQALPKFLTRVVNTFAATDASRNTLNDLNAICNRFRPKAKKKAATKSDENASESKPRKNSQLDYDSRIDNFEAVVKLLLAEPLYKPNEKDLQIAHLKTMLADLREAHRRVGASQVALSNGYASRNSFLYRENGIHQSAKAIKHYIKSVFGFESVAYNQVKGIKFKNMKIA